MIFETKLSIYTGIYGIEMNDREYFYLEKIIFVSSV